MWLANRRPCAIISADSRQIYRGFDIGTAKPSPIDRERVPHFGIDVVDPTERYSAAKWCAAATDAIDQIRARGLTPLLVGGTGLYLRVMFEGLFSEPEMDVAERAALAAVLGAMETSELRRWTEQLDPARAHLGRVQLLRAVEVALLSGLRVSALHAERPHRLRWRPCYLVVDPGPVLASRNAARTAGMIAEGWVDETRELMRAVPGDAPAWNSTGYDIMRRHVSGEIDLARARDQVIVETRQYVKRQRTWFRHQLPPERTMRVNPEADGWKRVVAEWWSATEERGR